MGKSRLKNSQDDVSMMTIKGIGRINIFEALATITLFEEKKNFRFIDLLRNILFVLFKTRTTICDKGSDLLFFFSSSYMGRKNNITDFNSVLSCCDNYTSFISTKQSSFSLKKLLNIYLIFVWTKKLKIMYQCTNGYAFHLATILFSGYCYFIENKKTIMDKIKICKCAVTFCDAHPADYLITIFLKNNGVFTMTLQHALYSHIKYGFQYRNSHSDLFIASNILSIRERELSGVCDDKYAVLGPMNLIDALIPESFCFDEKNVIGIAMSGPHFLEINKMLFNMGVLLSEKTNRKLLVRLHPALKPETFFQSNSDNIILSENESLDSFFCRCSYVLTGPTNMFGDSLCLGHVSYRLENENDFYPTINGLKFSSLDDLLSLDIAFKTRDTYLINCLVDARNMLIPSTDIKSSYTSFFKKIVRGEF